MRPEERIRELEEEIHSLKAINEALMKRVEKSVDAVGSAYSLFESNILLQESVEQRTAEIRATNDRLRQEVAEREQAVLRAEEASRTKTEFLANMSHEIRTPLNGVIGMTKLLFDSDLPLKERDFAKTAHDSGQMLLSVVNDILDVSKIEAGKLTLEPVEMDLLDHLESVTEIFGRSILNKGLRFHLDIDPRMPRFVIGDPVRLRQIIGNLLGNAQKFTETGSVELIIRRLEPDSAGHFRFSVKDTGIGIARDAQQQIFQSFTQADSTTTRRFGGTGLGLTICHQLVGAMGGSISVDSIEGQGSRFDVTLTLATADEPAGFKDDLLQHVRGRRALLLGEPSRNREILARQLRFLGVDLPGLEGLDPPDFDALVEEPDYQPEFFIVSESELPDDFSSFTLQEQKSWPEVPVIFVGKRVKSQTDLPEPDSILFPPVTPRRLRRTIFKALHYINADECKQPETASPAKTEGARVLLVEDNPINQKLAVVLLENLGCVVEKAGNGKEALNLISKTNFDLVFMDCQMPIMDGYEASRHIRELSGEASKLPIVAMTANALHGDREKCLEAGMDDYLSKPVSQDAIRDAVLRWIDRPTMEPSRTSSQSSPTVSSPDYS